MTIQNNSLKEMGIDWRTEALRYLEQRLEQLEYRVEKLPQSPGLTSLQQSPEQFPAMAPVSQAPAQQPAAGQSSAPAGPGPRTPVGPRQGDPRFLAILERMRRLHLAKSSDYGQEKDYLHNLRASAAFGVDPWVGAIIRLNDKVTRIQSFLSNGRLACESLEDSLLDIACYAILALILFEETMSETPPESLKEIMPEQCPVPATK